MVSINVKIISKTIENISSQIKILYKIINAWKTNRFYVRWIPGDM